MDPCTQYWVAVAIGLSIGIAACFLARAGRAATATWIGRALAVALLVDGVVFALRPVVDGDWTTRSSVPLDLCDVALVVAAVSCWFPRWQLGVELAYFWGLAGTVQAVVTPDLPVSFPDPEFFLFVVAHVGVVVAALYLVVGLRLRPRRGAVLRVFAITVAYTACVGVVDWVTGGNYMYLRRVPSNVSLLSVLGPWPWYIASAAVVAMVLFLLLDAPFRRRVPQRGRLVRE